MGNLNCREWWSRKVDVKCMLKLKSLDVLGIAETFLQLERKVDVPSYVWCGHKRIREQRASGGVGQLVKKNIRSKLLLRIEGAV